MISFLALPKVNVSLQWFHLTILTFHFIALELFYHPSKNQVNQMPANNFSLSVLNIHTCNKYSQHATFQHFYAMSCGIFIAQLVTVRFLYQVVVQPTGACSIGHNRCSSSQGSQGFEPCHGKNPLPRLRHIYRVTRAKIVAHIPPVYCTATAARGANICFYLYRFVT